MTSLAEYNNNPGNLRPPKGVTYDGQIGVDENGFAVFENKSYGKKALINDIQAKIEHGLVTPEAFIDKYSPAGDNDEEARINYKIHLADKLGLESTGDKFSEKDAEKIADAIEQFEVGSVTKEDGEKEKPSEEEKPVDKPINDDIPISDEREPSDLRIPGGIAGAVVGAKGEAIKGGIDIYRRLKGKPSSSATNLKADIDNVVTGAADTAPYPDSYPKPLGPRESTGTGTFNYGKRFGLTNTDAARAIDMSKDVGGVWDLSKKAAEAERKIQQRFGGYGFQGVPDRSDLLLPTSRTVEKGTVSPAIPGVTKAAQVPRAVVPDESWLSKKVGKAASTGKKILSYPLIGKPLSIAASGASGVLSAMQLQDAYNQWKQQGKGVPSWTTFTKGLSGIGGGLGTIPTVPTRAIGAALQAPDLATEAALASAKYAPDPRDVAGLPVFGN